MHLTDRFLPRLRQRNCAPELLVFPSYNEQQLLSIVCERLQQADRELSAAGKKGKGATWGRDEDGNPHLPFFERDAVELCARKVAAQSGDIRKCLDICCQALRKLSTKLYQDEHGGVLDEDESEDEEAEEEDQLMVNMMVMSRLLRHALGSKHVQAIQVRIACVAPRETRACRMLQITRSLFFFLSFC